MQIAVLVFQPAEGRISPHNKDATISGLRRNWSVPSRFVLFGVMKSAADTVSPSEESRGGVDVQWWDKYSSGWRNSLLHKYQQIFLQD